MAGLVRDGPRRASHCGGTGSVFSRRGFPSVIDGTESRDSSRLVYRAADIHGSCPLAADL